MASISFLTHFPYSITPNGNVADSVRLFGCPGETVCGSVSLRSTETINDIQILCTPLQANSFIIESADVLLVKHWEQSGIGIYQDKAIIVPELLVKDDRESLTDGYQRAVKHWRHLLHPIKLYEAPDIRLTGPVRTALNAGASKQLWLSIKIPRQTPAGLYKGEIDVSLSGEQLVSLPLELEVLPLALKDPTQSLFIWYKGSLDWQKTQHYVSEKTFRRHLMDIRAQGFRSFSIHETKLRYAKRAVEIAEEVGFSDFVLFVPPYHWDPGSWKPKKLKPVYYLSDELDVHKVHNPAIGEMLARGHQMNWQKAHESAPTMAGLLHQASIQKLFAGPGAFSAPDWISLSLPENRDYFHNSSNFPKQTNRNIFYYWPCHMEKPDVNRVLAGIYLWLSKADGIMPYCYQHMPVYPNSPFNDFDDWEPEFNVGNTGKFRQHMTTYPARSGTLSTVQWQGLLEGITDLKYLATFFTLHNSAMTSSEGIRKEAEHEKVLVEAFLKRIDLRNIYITSNKEREPYGNIRPEEYQQFRYLLAKASLRLTAIMKDHV